MTISPFGSGIATGTVGSELFVSDVNYPGRYTFHVDLSNMISGTYVELRAYQKILEGGSGRVAYFQPFQGVQPEDSLIVISDPPIANELTSAQSLRFSLKQTLGTACVFAWKVLNIDYNSTGSSSGDPWATTLPGSYTPGQAGHFLASRMPTGTVLVGDKSGFSLSSPQSFDLIGNISGTLTNVYNVISGSSSSDPWLTALPGAYGAGTAGNILGNRLDVLVSSRMPSGTVVVGTNNDKTGYSLSSPQSFDLIGNISGTLSNVLNVVNPVIAGVVTGSVLGNVNGSVNNVVQPVGINTGTLIGAIADGVWDEAIAGHLTAGSTGEKLNSAGSAGDPWSTALPGAYGAGSAGNILGNRLDVLVSSRQPSGTVVVATNNDKTGYSLATGTNIPANVKQINDTNVQGNGSSTPWGPA